MNTKCIILPDWQVQAARAGRLRAISVPMEPQPDHCHRDIIGKPKPWDKADWERLRPQAGDAEINPPWRQGDLLWVAEAWQCVNRLSGCDRKTGRDGDESGVRYRATWQKCHSIGWRSASTMPRELSRLTLRVTGDAAACRLLDATPQEMGEEGIQDATYSKPAGTVEREWLAAWDARWPARPSAGNPYRWLAGVEVVT